MLKSIIGIILYTLTWYSARNTDMSFNPRHKPFLWIKEFWYDYNMKVGQIEEPIARVWPTARAVGQAARMGPGLLIPTTLKFKLYLQIPIRVLRANSSTKFSVLLHQATLSLKIWWDCDYIWNLQRITTEKVLHWNRT